MKLKKVLAICLASAMTFSLAACGGTAAAPAPAAADNTAGETDEAEEADTVEEDAAEADAADDSAEETAGEVPAYTQLNLADYGDVSATIKFLHHKGNQGTVLWFPKKKRGRQGDGSAVLIRKRGDFNENIMCG